MSASPARFRFDKSDRNASPPRFHLASQKPSTFTGHKIPKFVIPKTPSTRVPQTTLREQPRTLPSSIEPRLTPKFVFARTQSPSNLSPRRQFTASLAPKRKWEAVDEIDSDESYRKERAHNPFDVSEELDEPSSTATPRRPGPPKFTTSLKASLGRPRSDNQARPASEVLSSLKFATRDSDEAAPRYKLPSDWSPHKKRGKPWEKSKFLPGGMAETVALWVYEAESEGR